MLHHLHQCFADLFATNMHSHTMSLHHGCLTIAVYYKSWKIITLTMNQTISIVVGIICDAYALTHRQCRGQPLFPEFIVNRYVVKRQHTDSDATDLIVPDSDEIAGSRDHSYEITFRNIIVHVVDGTGKDPRMETFQRTFLAFL